MGFGIAGKVHFIMRISDTCLPVKNSKQRVESSNNNICMGIRVAHEIHIETGKLYQMKYPDVFTYQMKLFWHDQCSQICNENLFT